MVQSVNNLIVYEDDIMKLYNGVKQKQGRGGFTCVHTFKNCEKSRYTFMILNNIEYSQPKLFKGLSG